MFLIDTNCFMQIIRNRPESPQVQALFDGLPRSRTFVTDFTVHSIGVVMSRFGEVSGYISFMNSLGIGREIAVMQIEFKELGLVANACRSHRLDFDDAYQYIAAEQNALKIVSFDNDFDKTPNGRLTPAAALQLFKDEQQKP